VNNPDIVFKCKKCGHLLFVDKNNLIEKTMVLIKKDCPECGQEYYRNWILSREGNYAREYKKELK